MATDATDRAPTPSAPGDGGAPRPRSACASEARRREARRILQLSPTDRALLALDLGARYAAWARGER